VLLPHVSQPCGDDYLTVLLVRNAKPEYWSGSGGRFSKRSEHTTLFFRIGVVFGVLACSSRGILNLKRPEQEF